MPCRLTGFQRLPIPSFADQEDGNFRDQQVAYLVENSYPAVTNHKYPTATPARVLAHRGAAIAEEFAWHVVTDSPSQIRLANRDPGAIADYNKPDRVAVAMRLESPPVGDPTHNSLQSFPESEAFSIAIMV